MYIKEIMESMGIYFEPGTQVAAPHWDFNVYGTVENYTSTGLIICMQDGLVRYHLTIEEARELRPFVPLSEAQVRMKVMGWKVIK